MFALSVSISTSSSPTDTSSPTDLSHRRTVPSSMESESRGMTISATAAPLQRLECGADHVLGVRDRGLLHSLRVRHVDVRPGHSLDRRIEVVERLALDQGGEVGAD